MRTIEITIGPAGESTVRTTGFTGPSCRDASRFVEQALGDRTAERLTGEFYERETARQQLKQE
jgi:hypothetical protein